MARLYSDDPKALGIALRILLWTVFLVLSAIFAQQYLSWTLQTNYILIGAFGSAILVGRDVSRHRRTRLSGGCKCAAAFWYTALALALAAAVLRLDDGLDHQLLLLEETNQGFLLIVAALTAALFVPLTVIGLWIGERTRFR